MKSTILLCLLLIVSGCPGSGDSGAGGGNGALGGNPFKPTTPQSLSVAVEQEYYCASNEDSNHPGFNVSLNKSGQMQVVAAKNDRNYSDRYEGTYEIKNNVIRFSLQNGSIEDQSIQSEVALGLLLTYKSQYLNCHATGHDKGRKVQGEFLCPTIKYIPNVGYEDNKFTFYQNGMVLRNRTKEISGVDTLYRRTYGIYIIEGSSVAMFFGDLPTDDSERVLTGSIVDDQGFRVDQLEPEKGMCK